MFKLTRCLALASFLAAQTPDPLQPPKDQVLRFKLTGKGSQIYVCQNSGGAFKWVLKAPDAKLYNESGELAGRHFAGPTWEATDGSQVKGKMLASVPSPDANAIPWLLVTAVSHAGSGSMTGIQSIQRLETKGGKAPGDGCDAQAVSKEVAIPYEANYLFYGEKP
jgi:hypothetical protein